MLIKASLTAESPGRLTKNTEAQATPQTSWGGGAWNSMVNRHAGDLLYRQSGELCCWAGTQERRSYSFLSEELLQYLLHSSGLPVCLSSGACKGSSSLVPQPWAQHTVLILSPLSAFWITSGSAVTPDRVLETLAENSRGLPSTCPELETIYVWQWVQVWIGEWSEGGNAASPLADL